MPLNTKTSHQIFGVPGSRWWKCDFHTHTPASSDYKEMGATEDDWLKAAMSAGIDCVVVTDHNSGEWIDRLKARNAELSTQNPQPEWYRELHIFPGVEITVGDSASRVHLLAVFDVDCDSQVITAVLGACGIENGFGDGNNTATSKSFLDVVQVIKGSGGIAIPAHIDGAKGLLDGKNSLTPELKRSLDTVFAAEFRDIDKFDTAGNDLKPEIDRLAKIAGSDAHTPKDIGKHTSWIKMSGPSITGLRLAMSDRVFCVKNQAENPNHDPDIYLTRLAIENMSVCGRIPGQPFVTVLHPHFNSLIGGRGAGKSTLVESIRLAARREQSLPDSSRTGEKIEHFVRLSGDKGVMLDNTEILLELQRRGATYRLRWRKDGNGPALDEKQHDTWVPVEAGNIQERFPLSIYSQKQIEELASNPRGLLDIIDLAPDVDRAEWQTRWDSTASRFFQLKERERDLSRRLADEPRFRVKLADVERDLKQYEEKGHGEILKNYQKRIQQWNGLPRKEDFNAISRQISDVVPALSLPDFPSHIFDDEDDARGEIQSIYEQSTRELRTVAEQLRKLSLDVMSIGQRWEDANNDSKFAMAYRRSVAAYKALVEEYAEKQSQLNLATYSEWVSLRNQLQQQLRELTSVRKDLETTQAQIAALGAQFKTMREELLDRRARFVNSVIGGNSYVRMEFVPFGDISTLESDYRDLLGLEEGRFVRSVYEPENERGILFSLIQWERPETNVRDIPDLLAKVKTQTLNIANGISNAADTRFDARLNRLLNEKPQLLDRFEIWFPEDLLRVKYSPAASNSRFNDLEKGSAGQKAAAILAFLLSYGKEPLVIDQPEDDLDNALIYDLIVKQIHENKNRRQLIIATHNPNIVVNGDSELVHILKFAGGQIQLDCQGGLEEIPIRESICTIMEGGREAFDNRYKRITLEA
ncbi:MAG: AAA family ATPase [Synergistaceae bacterium]|jgi:predicted metal-dependent phosphoesterase TrpH/energy-coupling factor transporter ATP-binding protein EcfA2|nr:AAA family ATPase [Synergistaceae bacterium]